MTVCSGRQNVIMRTCAIISNINTPSFLMCFISTQTVSSTIYKSMLTSKYSTTAMSTSDTKSISNILITTATTISGITSLKSLENVTDLSSTQTDHLFYSTSTEMYATTSLITTSVILTINSTNDVKAVSDNSLSQKSGTVKDYDSTSANVFNPSFILQNTAIEFTDSIITSIVSTPLYNDNTVPFTTNNITLILFVSLVILLIISMLSCGVIVVIVIIKRRKTYKTNNGK